MIADGAPGRARRPWWPLLFVAVATAIMLPELLWGLSASDSYRVNLLWTDEFTSQFAAGNPWPRWLSQSWDERGSIIVPTAQPVTGLVTWPTPAGRHHYRLEPGPAPGERASLLVSFLALMLLGLTLWQPLRTSLRKVLPFTARTSS